MLTRRAVLVGASLSLLGAPAWAGDVEYRNWRVNASAVPGPLADAASSYDETWADATAQLQGRYDPCVGFMQGVLKVKGATRPLYEAFRLWASPQHADRTSQLSLTTPCR